MPQGLPPGRYYVKVQLVEYLREGGRPIVAPKSDIRAFEYLTCTFDVPQTPPGKPIEWRLPGSSLSAAEAMNEAMQDGSAFAAVCEAIGEAPLIFDSQGVPDKYRTGQSMKIVDVLAGQVKAGEQVTLNYSWSDVPTRHERSVGKGEKLIWIVRRQTFGDSGHTLCFTGEKPLFDTPQNRKLVEAAESGKAPPAAPLVEPTIQWGDEVRGLQMGLSRDPRRPAYHHGDTVRLNLYARNRGDKPVTLVDPVIGNAPDEVSLAFPAPTVQDASGKKVQVEPTLRPTNGVWIPRQRKTGLLPGKTMPAGAIVFGIGVQPGDALGVWADLKLGTSRSARPTALRKRMRPVGPAN